MGPLRTVSSAGAGLAIFKRSFDSVKMNSASHLVNLAQAPIGLHCTGQSPLHLRGLGHVTIEAFEKNGNSNSLLYWCCNEMSEVLMRFFIRFQGNRISVVGKGIYYLLLFVALRCYLLL